MGTNLSNSFLENANLRNADLSGANLNNVDLRGANLSGAFLNYATFENTIFGYNSGISNDLKQDLIQRGAIFEDDPNSGDRSEILVKV